MGLFEAIFGKYKQTKVADGYFKTLTAYSPVFYTWSGKLYESELVRSAIDARARHTAKLKVEVTGDSMTLLQRSMMLKPNSFQTWSQFLYRLSTILDMQNTAFIVPVIENGEITGYFPVLPSRCEIVTYEDVPYIRYQFSNGQVGAIELDKSGIMTKFQYESDVFGSSNSALNNTMSLIDLQKQGIKESIKNSATYRFMAQVNNFTKAESLSKERQRFTKENLSSEAEAGGLLLFPNTYQNIQQLKNTPYTVDTAQMELIQTNVFNYFGVNKEILQNSAFGDAWSAFYEGAIEPFSVQFSEVITNMTFTKAEQLNNKKIIATANRLQYMSNKDKLEVSAQMTDRGVMSINEVREIWNLPPVEGGDIRVIRGEYWNADDKTAGGGNNAEDD